MTTTKTGFYTPKSDDVNKNVIFVRLFSQEYFCYCNYFSVSPKEQTCVTQCIADSPLSLESKAIGRYCPCSILHVCDREPLVSGGVPCISSQARLCELPRRLRSLLCCRQSAVMAGRVDWTE